MACESQGNRNAGTRGFSLIRSIGGQILIWVLGVASAFCNFGCSPGTRIFLKEKVIERSAAPRPGIRVDRFLYGKPRGNVDILFVVDNTETLENAISNFYLEYNLLLEGLRQKPFSGIDFRSQVVATPSERMPKAFARSDESPRFHLNQVFGVRGSTLRPVIHARESGYVRPLEAAMSGLSSPAFQGRDGGPLFLVFILGSDVGPGEVGVAKETVDAFVKLRGAHQIHLLTVAKPLREMRTSDVNCRQLQPPLRTLEQLASIPWRTSQIFNLCDSKWGGFSKILFETIAQFRTRLVLSQVPAEVESIVLRGSNRLYRYGEDYQFDPGGNEIIFTRPGLCEEGDLLEAAYFLEPREKVLDGSPTPSPKKP